MGGGTSLLLGSDLRACEMQALWPRPLEAVGVLVRCVLIESYDINIRCLGSGTSKGFTSVNKLQNKKAFRRVDIAFSPTTRLRRF